MFSLKKLYKGIAYSILGASLIAGGIYVENKVSSWSFSYHIEKAQKAEVKGDLERAVDEYDRAVKRKPKNIKIHKKKGDIQRRRGDRKKAAEEYKKTIELMEKRKAPDMKNIEKIVKSSGYYEPKKSSVYEKDNEKYDIAAGFYKSALDKLDSGDKKGALADLDRALQEDPEFVDGYMKRGMIRFELNDYFGAFSDFSMAVNLDPENEYGYNNLGISRYFLGRETSGESLETDLYRLISIDDVSKAIELNPYVAGFYKTRGNLEHDGGSFYYEWGIKDMNFSWEWANFDYEMNFALSIEQTGDAEDKDTYCRLGRVKKALGDEKGCSRNKNICDFYYKAGEVESFPIDYICDVIEFNGTRYIRYEYDVNSGQFIAQ